MRALSLSKMAIALRENRVGTMEFWIYAACVIALLTFSLGIWLGAWMPVTYNPTWLKFLDQALCILATIASFTLAYVANQKGDGQYFWKRCISFTIPAVVLLFPLMIAIYIGMYLLGIGTEQYFGYPDLAVVTLFYVLSVYWAWKYMLIASGANQ